MKREEFIELYADRVAVGRKKHHPDIRPSEAAVSRMSDEKSAAKLWRVHRSYLTTITPEEFIKAEENNAKVAAKIEGAQ